MYPGPPSLNMIEDLVGLVFHGIGSGVGYAARGVQNKVAQSRQHQATQAIANVGTRPNPQADYPTGAWTANVLPAVAGCRTPPGWTPIHDSRARQTREAIAHGSAPWGVWQQGLVYPVPWAHTVDLTTGTDSGSHFVCDLGGEPLYLRGMEEYYIIDKPNLNILITGTSGQGKSVLQSHLVRYWASGGARPIIFSFKPHDVYSECGFPVADLRKFLPDPFENIDALVEAMSVAYPMAQSGPTAASVGMILRGLAGQSANWQDLLHNIATEEGRTEDVVRRGALNILRSQVEHLVVEGARPFSLSELAHPLVLDFSGLSSPQQSFYGELALRQVWAAVASGKMGLAVVCFDEAHRILKGIDHSILGEIAREIRAFGALWVTTQAFTDLPDELKAQFATWFAFATHSPSDLHALRQLGPLYAEVGMLPQHCFTDVRWPVRHSHLPVFQLVPPRTGPVPSPAFVPPARPASWPVAMPQDLSGVVVDRITEEGAMSPSEVTKLLAGHYSADAEIVKPRVLQALSQQLRREILAKCTLDSKTGSERVLYYRRDPAESGLHRWMVNQVASALLKLEKPYTITQGLGVGAPDIEGQDAVYEIETGLKHDIEGDLVPRIQRARKSVFIVVPNKEVRERYLPLMQTYRWVNVTLLREWTSATKP